jgi:hypothetical protein
MKVGDYFVENGLRQNLANASGKMSTQFMSADVQRENPSRRRTLEESARMEGYDISVRKLAMARSERQQPMAKCSEFWIG